MLLCPCWYSTLILKRSSLPLPRAESKNHPELMKKSSYGFWKSDDDNVVMSTMTCMQEQERSKEQFEL